jgi:ABC-type phosphate/phosphonate transport system ATPase subunit
MMLMKTCFGLIWPSSGRSKLLRILNKWCVDGLSLIVCNMLDCSTRILFKMGLYYSQVFQQLQLISINSFLSTLKQYLSVQSSFRSSLLNVLFCTQKQHSTANNDCLWQSSTTNSRPQDTETCLVHL